MKLQILFYMILCAAASADTFIPANDTRLAFSDFARMTFIDFPGSAGKKIARFDRIADPGGKGYQWDNPGARLRFRTDASSINVHLYYNEKHISTSARNPVGRYAIDGKIDNAWRFTSVQTKTVRTPEMLIIPIAAHTPGMHDYDIILPYGDSVDVVGVTTEGKAHFETPSQRPAKRLVAYGDSITHGFTASEVTSSYAFLFAQRMNWQIVNMGIGGRGSAANDGTLIASQNGDVVIMLIGVNDWQGGRPVASFKANMEGFIKNLRKQQPLVPIIVITPLWVPASWKPKSANIDLEEYRKALREIVAAAGDANIRLVEGPALIDHDEKYFDKVAVHPNDKGFAMMAERLAAAQQ
ncbi:MAG: GDSL-type esterase/lipase family protein [Lentisphaerota bacterium]